MGMDYLYDIEARVNVVGIDSGTVLSRTKDDSGDPIYTVLLDGPGTTYLTRNCEMRPLVGNGNAAFTSPY